MIDPVASGVCRPGGSERTFHSVAVLRWTMACLLSFCLALPLEGARRKKEVPQDPVLSLVEARPFLTVPELRLWEAALKDLNEAEKLIESGKWNLEQTPSEVGNPEENRRIVARARQQGQQQIAEGEKQKMAAINSLRELSRRVLARREASTGTPTVYNGQIRIIASDINPQLLSGATASVLQKLWADGASRVTFGGAYASGGAKLEDWSKLGAELVERLDGNRYSYIELDGLAVTVRDKRVSLDLTLTEGDLPAGSKVGVVFFERLPVTRGLSGFVVRGIRAATGEVAAMDLALSCVPEVWSEGAAVEFALDDQTGFFETVRKVGSTPYRFSVHTGGVEQPFNRALLEMALLESGLGVIPSGVFEEALGADAVSASADALVRVNVPGMSVEPEADAEHDSLDRIGFGLSSWRVGEPDRSIDPGRLLVAIPRTIVVMGAAVPEASSSEQAGDPAPAVGEESVVPEN